jgi:hypothetical protein
MDCEMLAASSRIPCFLKDVVYAVYRVEVASLSETNFWSATK